MSSVEVMEHLTPAANGKSRALASWEDFNGELKAREHEIATLLPRHISKDRFMSSAVAAVKQNPDLLKCSPRSLFQAVTQSAQDGLLPDGREGVITKYGTEAKWNPMTWGLRKRAKEIDGIIIDAQVVHKGDHFVWHQGDDPKIEHVPAELGTPRGAKVGAYAIFKDGEGRILHREVMDVEQIGKVKEQSKAQNSLMWTKFEEEGFKKSVVRRGIKSVPCSDTLEAVVHRDDDLFAFDEDAPRPQNNTTPPAPPPPAVQSSPVKTALRASVVKERVKDAPVIDHEPSGDVIPMSSQEADLFLDDLKIRLDTADCAEDVNALAIEFDELHAPRMLQPDVEKAREMIAAALGA